MAYFLAASLVQLRNEINAAHPSRDKTSDGWIGDASHQARASDHNPDYAAGGIVRAIDVDKDGINIQKLWNVVVADPRVEYVIWNYRIYTRQNGFKAQVYNGTNPHDKHMHISIRHTAAAAAGGRWGYSAAAPAPAKPAAPAPAGPYPAKPGISITDLAKQVIAGDWGNNPQRGQKLLAAGFAPTKVQAEVNRLLGKTATAPATVVRPSVTAIAKQVIAGQWGNGVERQQRITRAGYDYNAVRAEVNRLLA